MTLMTLYGLNPEVTFDDYLKSARASGYSWRTAEVHTAEVPFITLIDVEFEGKDLAAIVSRMEVTNMCVPMLAQRTRDFLNEKYGQPQVPRTGDVPITLAPTDRYKQVMAPMGPKDSYVGDQATSETPKMTYYVNVGDIW